MKRPIRLGVDIDGVLARFDGEYSKMLIAVSGENRFGCDPDEYQPPLWEYDEALYSKEEIGRAWAEIAKPERAFWRSLPAYSDAERFLQYLGMLADPYVFGLQLARVNEIYFITSRAGETAHRQTLRWLSCNGWWGHCSPQVLIARGEKGYLANALGLSHFIDDRPENCRSVRLMAPDCHTYLLDRSWNQLDQHFDWCREHQITRLDNVHQFIGAVEAQERINNG